MSLDSFRTIWGNVLLRCPTSSPLLAQNWVNNAFRRVAEKRTWSWLTGLSQMVFPPLMATGLVTVNQYSASVVGDATAAAAWIAVSVNQSLIGQQFRLGSLTPIYTVIAFDGVNTLTLDEAWGAPSSSLVGYQIYQAYITVPSDFFAFQTVIDAQMNWQLWANKWSQSDLNTWDAQRASSGNPYAVVFRDGDFNLPGATTPPLPRYEVWPHVRQNYVLPFLYVKRATDLTDSGAFLPRYIRGDVLMEGALADAARWPGPSADRPNPYYSTTLYQTHEAKFEAMVGELEKQDDEIFEQDIKYQLFSGGLPWSPFPGDARFLQSHLLPGYGSGVY